MASEAPTTPKRRHELLEAPQISSAVRQLLIESPTTPSKKPRITAPQGSSLVNQLHSFLPKLRQANADLKGKKFEEISVEHTGADSEPHIELELACGLFDLNTAEAVAAAEKAMRSGCMKCSEHSDSSDSDSDSSDSSQGSIESAQRSIMQSRGKQNSGKKVEGKKGRSSQPPSHTSKIQEL